MKLRKITNRVCRISTKWWRRKKSSHERLSSTPFCKVSLSNIVHLQSIKKQFDWTSLLYVIIISYCVIQNYLSKQSLKFVTIISAKNKADTRIYGTICQSHAVDNIEIMWDATIRKYDSVRKEANTPEDSDGEPAYCKSQHNSNGHLQHIFVLFDGVVVQHLQIARLESSAT